MKAKTIITMTLCALMGLSAQAQQACELPLHVIIPEQTVDIGPGGTKQLVAKIRQVVTQNGMTGGAQYSQFHIEANLMEVSKEMTSGLRPLVTVTTELELSVGNSVTGGKFGSTSITLSGAGKNERAAYMAAISNIRPINAQLKSFLRTTKEKIIQYYESQTDNIVRKANQLAAKQQVEEALFLLTSIPTCCTSYEKAEEATLKIFQDYLNQDCQSKISKARHAWNASQDREGAHIAGAYLSAINPAAQCYDDAMELADEIRQRIGEEWEWAKDLKEFAKETVRIDQNLELERIKAARAIGEAYANNQKETVINQKTIVKEQNNNAFE